MTSEKSKSFQQAAGKPKTFYTYNHKKETKMTNKIKKPSVSVLEIDHYNAALKKGVFNAEKEKIRKEKKKAFEKAKKDKKAK